MADYNYMFVYKVTNLINGRIYIGSKCTNRNDLDPDYLCSGNYIVSAVKKYGKENFVREILSFHNSKEELYQAETAAIRKNFQCLVSNGGYNISNGAFGGDVIGNLDKKQLKKYRLRQTLTWKKKGGRPGPPEYTRKQTSDRMQGNQIAKGRKWFNNGHRSVMAYECPNGFRPGRSWKPSEEFKEKRSQIMVEKFKSMTPKERKDFSNKCKESYTCNMEKVKGTKWFNNGTVEVMRKRKPRGKEWKKGRLYKKSWSPTKGLKWYTDGKSDTLSADCPGLNWFPGRSLIVAK